jgi:hypothetical protein
MVVEGPIADVLGAERALEVEARPAARALDVLGRFGAASLDGDRIVVRLRGSDAAAATRALVEAGVEVASIAQRRTSLEALVVGDEEPA